MAYTDPLLAMGDALYGLLAVDATLLGLASGGVHMDVPQDPNFPFVWIELRTDSDHSGFGSQPGRRSRPGIHLRVHVFQSEYGTVRDAQIVMGRVVDLLWNDQALLTADGYEVFCGKPMPRADEILLADEILRGQKVQELVLMTDYIIEEAA